VRDPNNLWGQGPRDRPEAPADAEARGPPSGGLRIGSRLLRQDPGGRAGAGGPGQGL